jgi:putative transposase
MKTFLKPWQLLLLILAGWMNHRQQDVIEYLRAENRVLQIARNMSDAEDGSLRDKKYLLMDRDTKFSKEFRDILENVDVKAIRLLPRSPNLSPHLERFMRSIKEECLERMIFFGEKSLHAATRSYIDHYHAERNHQGVGNRLLIPGNEVNRTAGKVACRERLGGLLQYYYRKAA